LQAQLKLHQPTRIPSFNRTCKANPRQILFLKNSQRLKKIKHPTKKSSTMTAKYVKITVYSPRQTRTPAYNRVDGLTRFLWWGAPLTPPCVRITYKAVH